MDAIATLPAATAKTEPDKWFVRQWNDILRCCTKFTTPDQLPRIVSVIDIGSNSLKQLIVDMSQSPVVVVATSGEPCGLAADMVPNDKKPRLSEAGMELVLTKALPKFLEKHKIYNVDTIIVVCTEAVRAAHAFDKKAVNIFITKIAKALGVPALAINILDESTEAYLAAVAALIGQPHMNGIALMGGGGSAEAAKIRHGITTQELRTTLRLGSRSLLKRGVDPATTISKALSKIPWFSHQPNDRETSMDDLGLLGGLFRGPGRIIGQRLLGISPTSSFPFGGISHSYSPQLIATIEDLHTTNAESLREEFIRYALVSTGQINEGDLQKGNKSKKYREALASFIEAPMYKRWMKRIEARAAAIPVAATFTLHAIKLVKPKIITFIAQSIRDAIIREFNPVSWQKSVITQHDDPSSSKQSLPSSIPAPRSRTTPFAIP